MNVRTTLHWATPYSASLLLGLALAAVATFTILRWVSGRPIIPARRTALLVIRLLTLAFLALILVNPVWVDRTPGSVEKPKVVYLVDTSQSMALGKDTTRWDRVVQSIRETGSRDAQLSVFRFGSRLSAVDSAFWAPSKEPSTSPVQSGAALAAAPAPPGPPPAPTDDLTLLTASLEGLTGRFGQTPPQAVVVFSDGRAADPERADAIARAYGKMKIPVHVFPVGDREVGGDLAIVSMIVPPLARKHTQIAAQVFVRSFGFDGQRAELKLVAAGPDDQARPVLAKTPVVLRDGLTSFTLAFDSGDQDRRIEARIDPRPGEVSLTNNVFGTDLAIDHTKIRILYLEGLVERAVVPQTPFVLGETQPRGAFSPLQEALMDDPDVECTVITPGGADSDFSFLVRANERTRGLPETPSELYAYDAIILSNIPREALGEQTLAWIDEWISHRGGGLCMVGGPNSFGSGQWAGSSLARMLPVELLPTGRDWIEGPATLTVDVTRASHPIWHISSDDVQNRAIIKTLPEFRAFNEVGPVKSNATVLAQNGNQPAIAVQPFGRGRTMAMTTPITRRWSGDFTQTWGEKDARYYKKFWRNVIYWLTENSSIGRRRLLAETDKRLYRPGEPVVLRAQTFDENASLTLDYRVSVSVEPRSTSSVTSDESPLRRPSAAVNGPLLPWGEEVELARLPADKAYTTTFPVAEARSLPTGVSLTQGLRIELTAYENNTQVDSTALDIQLLDDPAEQQNPLPDHDLLKRIARQSGGQVLNGSNDLSSMLARLPRVIGPAEIKTVPAWSQWWLLSVLLTLLTIEWVVRRRLGLA